MHGVAQSHWPKYGRRLDVSNDVEHFIDGGASNDANGPNLQQGWVETDRVGAKDGGASRKVRQSPLHQVLLKVHMEMTPVGQKSSGTASSG